MRPSLKITPAVERTGLHFTVNAFKLTSRQDYRCCSHTACCRTPNGHARGHVINFAEKYRRRQSMQASKEDEDEHHCRNKEDARRRGTHTDHRILLRLLSRTCSDDVSRSGRSCRHHATLSLATIGFAHTARGPRISLPHFGAIREAITCAMSSANVARWQRQRCKIPVLPNTTEFTQQQGSDHHDVSEGARGETRHQRAPTRRQRFEG